jgi:hypothetical protein
MTAGMPAADELSAVGAFSSEVDTPSRQENASKQRAGGFSVLISSKRKGSGNPHVFRHRPAK